MIFTPQTLYALRLPLFMLIAVLALGAYMMERMVDKQQAALDRLEREQGHLREARQRYEQSGQERALIERYLPEYRRLEREGFIGPGARVNWLDALRVADQQVELFGAEYELGPQKAYPTAPGGDQLPMSRAPMKISFQLLHEADLTRFFLILREQRVGIFELNQCTLARIGAQSALARYEPKLQAECEVSWVTVTPGNTRASGS
ncbi:MAG TPA: hypothetical protein VLA73_10445 [Burkholderiales bacterium]|nr:hypothetical protein [Burkholderiales bacterium]